TPSPIGGVGQHASPSRRRSPVRTRYGVRAPLAGGHPAPTGGALADVVERRYAGPNVAVRRGGASPPVGTTPPAPAGPRPLYRRVRGPPPRGGALGRRDGRSRKGGTQAMQAPQAGALGGR